MLIPVVGRELSQVQFRPLEEQVHRSMVALFDQRQRQYTVRLAGMRAPLSVATPQVEEALVYPSRVRRYVQEQMRRLPFALPTSEALRHLQHREATFAETFAGLGATNLEPSTTKRRVR